MKERFSMLAKSKGKAKKLVQSMDSPKTLLEKRKKYVKWGGITILLIIALFTLPIPLGNIEIVGSNKITQDDIIAAGNLGTPVNILRVKTSQLQDNLNHDLRIDQAKVGYAFPLTLKVEIVDRQAVGVIVSQFGYATVDKNGVVINLGSAIEDTTVPILSGIRLGNVLLGDSITDENIKPALAYLNALTPEGKKNISEINIGDPSMMIAYTVDGLPVHIGDGSDIETKAQLTEDMLKDVKDRHVNAEYIDVNVKAPFVKMN